MTYAYRFTVKWARTLHVYLTLFGFMLLLFFAVTGFMLNHEDWFNPQQTIKGKIPLDILAAPENRDPILEKLRDDFLVKGELESFDHDKDQNTFRVVFKTDDGPAVALIRGENGETQVTRDQRRSIEHIVEGKLPMDLLEPWDRGNELHIVEKLRKDFGVQGALKDFDSRQPETLTVMFHAPGYTAEATIQRGDGQTKVKHDMRGLTGLLVDLHRNRSSGEVWGYVVDGVSILFVMVSLTGLILWSSLRSRAQYGLVVLLLGLATGLAIYFVYVPR